MNDSSTRLFGVFVATAMKSVIQLSSPATLFYLPVIIKSIIYF